MKIGFLDSIVRYSEFCLLHLNQEGLVAMIDSRRVPPVTWLKRKCI